MTTDKTFRTETGQTGRDAYVYELAAIRNAKRVLDDRANALAATVIREMPEDATSIHRFGKRERPIDRATIVRMLELATGADNFTLDMLTELVGNLNTGVRS